MNLTETIDELYDIREQLRDLSKQEAALKDRYNELDAALLEYLEAAGLQKVSTSKATAITTESQVASLTDWDAFVAYVKTNDAWHLLQKRVASTRAIEHMEEDEIPGLSIITQRKIGLRKR